MRSPVSELVGANNATRRRGGAHDTGRVISWSLLGGHPILTGDAIHEAFNIVRDLTGEPIVPAPGHELLDALVATQRAA